MASGDVVPAGDGSRDRAGTDVLPSGTLFGRHRIIDLIGRGGMGVVYRAEHVDLGTPRALKTLSPELAHHPLARSRFLKEARAAARISHPHVVRIFDCGEQDGIPFFVMEHLEGEDLERAISRTKLTTEQTAGIMLAVCAAVAEMHNEGFIHRDIKPGNIFLARNKVGDIVPTVLDFGIARPIERGPSDTRTQDGVIVGTPHYIAPEQLADLPAGERTDQYALGVVLYRCATGALPFDADSTLGLYRRITSFDLKRPRELNAEISAALDDVIVRAMSERPRDRFASVYDLGKALLEHASPRDRAHWAPYYGQLRSPAGVVSAPIPVAGSAAWLQHEDGGTETVTGWEHGGAGSAQPIAMPRTEPLPMVGGTRALAERADAGTRALPHAAVEAAPSPPRAPAADHEDEVQTERAISTSHRSMRRRVFVVAGAVVAALGGAAWLLLANGGRTATESKESSPVRRVEVASPTPPSPERSASPSIAAPAAELPTRALPVAEPVVDRTDKLRRRRAVPRLERNVSPREASSNVQHAGTKYSESPTDYPAVGRPSELSYPAVH